MITQLSRSCASLALALAATHLTAQPPLYFRSIDGSANNLRQIDWGRAETPMLRGSTIGYADGRSAPAGADRPSARVISNAICAQIGLPANEQRASDFVWQWGQFLDHDLDLTGLADPAEPFAIAVPRGDPWFDPTGSGSVEMALNRSAYRLDRGGVRQQLNSITAWIDASNVYGSDAIRAAALRAADGSLLTSAGDLLPFNTAGLPNVPTRSARFFLAGDIRANEQVGLIVLHTLFVREHNRLAAQLQALGADAELTYQIARALVAAQIQAITYNEFLPALLGERLPPYRGYRAQVDPGIANAFATAAYRVGHSMLSPSLLRLRADGTPIAAGHLALRDAFLAPEQITDHGIEPILRGLAAQRAQRIDTMIIDDVRNFLFGSPGAGGFDLASLNVQRGRDHGLPSYRQLRRDYGLPDVRDVADISRDADVQARLLTTYGSIDRIDAWIGGLAEDHLPGAMVGPLFHRVLADQFARLRDADRYWYQLRLPPSIGAWVDRTTLAQVIRRNTTIGGELRADVFHVAPGAERRDAAPVDSGRRFTTAEQAALAHWR